MSITVDDLKADAERIPANVRYQALSDPNAVQQTSSNLFVRRALAAEAEKEGLDKDPVVASALRIIRDRLLSDLKLAEIDKTNKPSEAAVEAAAQAAYKANPERFRAGDEARVRHILIVGGDDKAKAEAEAILAALKAGADFAKMAEEKSQDPGSAPRGGDLGYFEAGKMVPEFDDAIGGLKNPGDLSGLVKTQFGWHIIKLEARRAGGARSYDDVKDALRQKVIVQLQSEARVREASRLAAQATFNREAIEAFSKANGKK